MIAFDLETFLLAQSKRDDGEMHNIRGCARCRKDHLVTFMQLNGEPIEDGDGTEWTHWGICPNTGDPVLMRIISLKD